MTDKNLLLFASALVAALGSAPLASATTYVGIRDVGSEIVDLSITTDGNLGSLNLSDVTAFNVTVSGPSGSFAFNSTDAGSGEGAYLVNGGFTATSNNLNFAINGSDYLYFSYQPDPASYDDYEIGSTLNGGHQGEVVTSNGGGTIVNTTESGVVQFATLAVPEPATWSLMLAGVFGVGAFARRRSKVSA